MRFYLPLLFLLAPASLSAQPKAQAQPHNVILFVADGLRRDSVTAADMPTFLRMRTAGVDFRNSHAVFPTFTTANASVIATGHGVGDTGDYSNVLYAGTWLSRADVPSATATMVPFVENDEILANLNQAYGGNYLGERTLLSLAREKGFNVASVGKLGPTAIQQIEALRWDRVGPLSAHGAIIVDDATGQAAGIELPGDVARAMRAAGLGTDAPTRTNGFPETSQAANGFAGNAVTPGTLDSNRVQEQWFADVTTRVLLPQFAEEKKPFLLLFWSRDPDGTQHNQGDSLQALTPGINGETSKLGLRNADHCLKQLLDWLDAHPAVKATTDVLVTSDHGFATISRRDVGLGVESSAVSTHLPYELNAGEAGEPPNTLPTGFLAVDLAVRTHLHMFDPAVRSATGPSLFAELAIDGDKPHHPSRGSALLGEQVTRLDAQDAQLIVASNGGSDLIYAPTHDAALVARTVEILAGLDYVGGIFADEAFCPQAASCPGALGLRAIGLQGSSKLPRPAIVVTFKDFLLTAGDLRSGVQVADTDLQHGQGMHGGFGRDQTFNNMAAMGPDFKAGFADLAPMGNIDVAPTVAKILGLEMPSLGTLRGRVLAEALVGGAVVKPAKGQVAVSESAHGQVTVLEYQEQDGVRYLDQACLVGADEARRCP